ncbi:MAG: glycosyltransferase family 2 protein [Planctomycetes bacterium]|nr:glycosyltransferase family 2 protein [Planctomycetota bacterium]
MTFAWRLPVACLLWAYSLPTLLLTLLVDLLCAPFVLAGRRVVDDESPRNRNASLLILNWNGIDFLRDLLPSVRTTVERTPGDHEVLVIDNGSDDGSAEFVEREFPWARVIRLPENRHFIRGNRAGVEHVSEDKDVLVFLNNDMVVEPDFLPALLDRFGDPDLFAVTARIEMDGEQVETGRTRFFYKRGVFRQEQIPMAAGVGDEPALWAGGGSSAFDRRKYEALGGFETLYAPCYMEDVSLSYAAWKRGWRVVFTPDAVVHHVHRGTSSKVFGHRSVELLNQRNRELFFLRSVTDLGWTISHAIHAPWNAVKDARWTDLRLQFQAMIRAIPRVPAALAARQRSRRTTRRTDRDLLAAQS